MQLFLTSQLEKPNFQLFSTTGKLAGNSSDLHTAISKSLDSYYKHTTIDDRIQFLNNCIGEPRTFTYFGPFNTIDELQQYFRDSYPELLL